MQKKDGESTIAALPPVKSYGTGLWCKLPENDLIHRFSHKFDSFTKYHNLPAMHKILALLKSHQIVLCPKCKSHQLVSVHNDCLNRDYANSRPVTRN